MKKQNIQEQINKTEEKLKELKLKLEKNSTSNNLLYIKELGIEIEIEISHKGKNFNEIMNLPEIKEKLKNGWRLLSTARKKDFVNEIAVIVKNETYSKILKMNGSSLNDDFFIEQLFPLNEKNNRVAGFGSYSGWSYLGFDWDADDSDGALGVRLCREKKLKQ